MISIFALDPNKFEGKTHSLEFVFKSETLARNLMITYCRIVRPKSRKI